MGALFLRERRVATNMFGMRGWILGAGLTCCLGAPGCGSSSSNIDNDSNGASTQGTSTEGTAAEGTANSTTGSTQTTSSNTSTTSATSNTESSSSGTTSSSSGSNGNNSNTATATDGSGGSDTGGTGSGGTGSEGGTSSGGSSSGGSNSGGTSSGGSAGSSTTTSGGSGGSGGDISECDTPYTGPIGGPRSGGPEPTHGSCESIDDETILARYNDLNAKVPQGLYWEPPGIVSWWEEPCSESPSATLQRSHGKPVGDVDGQVTSDWSYEVSGCSSGDRRIYSNLRCDYFDGTTLALGSYQELLYLVSLLWWGDNGNLGGSQILGFSANVGDATDQVTLCTIRTTYGDFGLCDTITLEQTTHRVTVDGTVTLGEPEVVRSIQGECH